MDQHHAGARPKKNQQLATPTWDTALAEVLAHLLSAHAALVDLALCSARSAQAETLFDLAARSVEVALEALDVNSYRSCANGR